MTFRWLSWIAHLARSVPGGDGGIPVLKIRRAVAAVEMTAGGAVEDEALAVAVILHRRLSGDRNGGRKECNEEE